MVPAVDYSGFLQHFGAECCIFYPILQKTIEAIGKIRERN